MTIPPRPASTPRPPLRHCPVCGVAMQAFKTRDDIDYFDRFECLSCHTTIHVPPRTAREDG